jgi:cysteine desulfurase/selenocysteine lyase
MAYPIEAVRQQFPALAQEVNGHPLVYLDTAASALVPEAVIRAVADYQRLDHANVHRGVHTLSQRATSRFEDGRAQVARFLHTTPDQVVFTRGTTEALNLVAYGLGAGWGPGDEIVVSELEHHANLVPWQLVAARTGARVVCWPVTDEGSLDLDALRERLSARTRVVALAHVSNVLGTVQPVAEVAALARAVGAKVVVDGAQGVVHAPVDPAALGADLYAFSGHKVYGPTGVGVLWGRADALEALPPWQGGGDMIDRVSFAGTTFAAPPARFEAGTPNISGVIGLGAAVELLTGFFQQGLVPYEAALLAEGEARLAEIPGVRRLGAAPRRAGVLTFTVDGVHPTDLAMVLDEAGVAVRTGHHCAQPLHDRFGLAGSARASLGAYTTSGDLEALQASLRQALRLLRR